MILFAIGMCEILENYSELSLAGQNLLMFPTTIAEKCTDFQLRRLVLLNEKWVWSGKNLRLAGIGNPKKLIKNLVDEKFKCEVSNNVKIADNFLEETELKLRDIVKGILVNIKKN